MRLRLSHNLVRRRTAELTTLIVVAFSLDVFAAVGLSYVAGFSAVQHALQRFQPLWLIGVVGGLALSFVGYYFAYREIYLAEGGPRLSARQLRAVVMTGFGGFFAHGAAAMDQYALEGAGADERDAKVRVSVLGGLEHGALGIIGTVAGAAALLMGRPVPPLDFQYPWAVIPLPGMLFAFWIAERYRDRLRDARGWRGKLGVFVDSIGMIRTMFRHPRGHGAGPLGMVAFWLAELWAAWAGLAAFGFHMDVASFTLGFLTGAVFTRRTGPLAGAGILMLCLPVTIWYSGAAFGAAIAGVFVVRFLSFWLPLPLALASLGTLRGIGREKEPHAEGTASTSEGEPALQPHQRRAG